MNSIGRRIQLAFMGSISVVALLALIMLFINQFGALQNQRVIQTMTMEYSIISLTDELVKTYSDVFKNSGSRQFVEKYAYTHAKLLQVIATLKTRIISEESKQLLVGVENTVNGVFKETDTGMKDIAANDFTDFSTHLFQANKENDFVKDNTSSLLQKELEYLSGSEKESERIYSVTLTFSLAIFASIIVVMIFFARSFSTQLITPLVNLSLFAEEIANGNLKDREKAKFAITNDETGSLTKSIYTMVDKLVEMVAREQRASEELKKTSATIESNNAELSRMNSLMVGRELKMSELKKEVEELTRKLNSPSSS